MKKTILIYDLEITPFSFIYGDFNINIEKYSTFVLSLYRDDRIAFKEYIFDIIKSKSWQAGFNNLNYDYPLLHYAISLMKMKSWETIPIEELLDKLNVKNKQLIPDNKVKKANKFGKQYNAIWKPLIPQIDLFKIHHFDNISRMTSLKKLEINMRFSNVEDIDWEYVIDNYNEELELKLIEYNINDINATKELYYLTRGQLDKVSVDFPGMNEYYSQDRLEFRIQMGKKYNSNMINFSDVKIGEEINKLTYLEKTGLKWKNIKDKRTHRQYINISLLIPKYIVNQFKHKQLLKLLKLMTETIIDVNNPKFEYHFLYYNNIVKIGLGGIHSDDKARIVNPDLINNNFEEHDVGSMYPTAIINNKSYPLHLGPEWLEGYKEIRDERIRLKPLSKKDKHTKMIVDVFKLSLNGGGYGKTGEPYNWQFDPMVKYSTTIKCQLDILLYCQMLYDNIPDLYIESYNTDGVNIVYDKKYENIVYKLKTQWEHIINGVLEITPYNKIIRMNVNNYIAIKPNNSVKLKGIFELEKELHKDTSNYIITKAVVDYFVKQIPIVQTIKNADNIYDFLASVRVQNTAQGKWVLFHNYLLNGKIIKEQLQKNNRYYISNLKDHTITKNLVEPILEKNEGKYSFIAVGKNPIPLNIVTSTKAFDYPIDYNYYIVEARKIINQIEDKQLKLNL